LIAAIPTNCEIPGLFCIWAAHQGVSEFVYFFAENPKIPPKIKIYKIHNKSTIKYNVTALKTGILESIKYL
jgi:hypothetical protein